MKERAFALAAAIAMLCFVGSGGHAAPVGAVDARKAAANWLAIDTRPLGADLRGTVREVRTFNDAKGSMLYYVVSLSPSGYVILSADDLVEPIIAFSPDGDYQPVPENPMYDLVVNDLSGRTERVKALQAGPTYVPEGEELPANTKWKMLLAGSSEQSIEGHSSISDPRVDPFVLSKWNQTTEGTGACYNYYTPPGPDGSSSNYPSGCVATAMAQLMRYSQYPSSPVATTCYNINTCGSLYGCKYPRGGNGSGGNYDWANMPLDPDSSTTTVQRQAIGALCYDAGVSVNMDYNKWDGSSCSGQSGADTLQAANGLKNVFRYSEAHKGYNSASDLPSEPRNRMINPNLHAGYPVLLGITGAGGHAIVCDGYGYNPSPTMYHHLNLGWSGSYTAWYNLPTIDAGSYVFNSVYKCVYNVFTSGTGEIIAGRVTDSGGSPMSGVTVSAGGSSTDTTDSRGVYALRVASGTSYTVTPQKTGYTFTPTSTSVTTGTSTDSTTTCGNKWPIDFVGGPETPADEDFETGNLTKWPWTTGGNANWSVTTGDKHGGLYSAKAGTITHSQSTYLQVALDRAAGNVSFYCKVSSESGYDYLRFYVDDVLKESWSGETGWSTTPHSYAVAAGAHTYKWVYSKDLSYSSGSDTAWIDDITFPPGGCTPPSPPTPPGTATADSTTQITWGWTRASGASGETYKAYDASSGGTPKWTSASQATSYPEGGLSANTLYGAGADSGNHRYLATFQSCESSERLPLPAKYTLQVTPTTPAFSGVGLTSMTVTTTDPVNLTSGSSGVVFNRNGADLLKVTVLSINETGLTPNCQYTYKVKGVNGENVPTAGYSSTASNYTLAKAGESTDGTCNTGNIYCTTAIKSTCYGPGKTFTFSNPCGFGTCGTWKASKFEYKWNKSTTEGWSTVGTSWNTDEIPLTANQGDGDYWLHVRAFNGDNAVNNTDILDYGPFHCDVTAPTSSASPIARGYTTPGFDVHFGVIYSWCADTGIVNLWYRCRPLSGGAWGAWTKYNGDFTVSPISFDSSIACGNAEYEFYTIATDAVGNVEDAPPQADCGTKILAGGLAAPVLNPEPDRTPGTTNEICWNSTDPIATLYEAQCSQDAGFASIEQDTGWQPRPPDCYTFGGLLTGANYNYRVRSGFELCPTAFGTWSQTSQTEFDTDQKSNVSTSASPGDVVLAGGGGPPATDTIGNSSTPASGAALYRLNCFNCTSSRTLTQIEIYLYIATSTQLQFVVYEGTTQSGTYNRIHSNTVTSSGTGTKFYSSGTISIPLQAGKYYLIGAGWQGSTTYYYSTSHPVAVAFGNSVAGRVGSGYPPPSTLTGASDLASYYHRLTSAGSGYVPAGTITSTAIAPNPFANWGAVSFTKDTSPAGTALTVDVLDATTGTPLLENAASGTDLNAAGVTASSIKLRANLSTSNSANTPTLSDWAVSYLQSEATTVASDWSNIECSSQLRVCGLSNRSVSDAIMASACAWMAFTVWGRVTVLEVSPEVPPGSFDVDDGSGPVRVVAPGHSLQTGDYASATGILDVSAAPQSLICEARLVRKIQAKPN